jgi:putative two-component system response regulator
MMQEGEPKTGRILVVDDEWRNLLLLESLLRPMGYDVQIAENGFDCLALVEAQEFDLIILDVVMPQMDGIEVCRQIKSNRATSTIPVIFVSGLDDKASRIRGKDAGADDFLTKPIDPTELRVRTRNLITLKAYHDEIRDRRDELEERVRERTQELFAAHEESLFRLSRAAEYKDTDTGSHLKRISGYVWSIADTMGFGACETNLIRHASITHDIGKIGIPESILVKPAKLTREEFGVMQTHTVIGARILSESKSELLQLSEKIALAHHEKWNGEGYPRQLAGKEIPVEARIVAVADVFDALCARRPYKEPYPVERAIDIIRDGAGNHFDPSVVGAFNQCLDQILDLQESCEEGDITSYILSEQFAGAGTPPSG